MLDKLTHDISNADFANDHARSVAYGYEICEGNRKHVNDVFVQADKNRYMSKQKRKLGTENKVDRI